VQVSVYPTLVPDSHVLASVNACLTPCSYAAMWRVIRFSTVAARAKTPRRARVSDIGDAVLI